MRFAYADPPYIGQAKLYKDHADYAGEVNHAQLVAMLAANYPDGWALSCSSPTLGELLALCPPVRVLAWVKPFCAWKRGQTLAYTWEPVIFYGGRRREIREGSVRDHLCEPMEMRRGLAGAKPEAFVHWLLDCFAFKPGDELADLYPGTGLVPRFVESYLRQPRLDFPGLAGELPDQSELAPEPESA